jgi:Lar family restriction alleviation protein
MTTATPIRTRSCPFCGAQGPQLELNEQMFCRVTITKLFAVACDDPDGCGAQGPFRHTMQTAIEAWNTRLETV